MVVGYWVHKAGNYVVASSLAPIGSPATAMGFRWLAYTDRFLLVIFQSIYTWRMSAMFKQMPSQLAQSMYMFVYINRPVASHGQHPPKRTSICTRAMSIGWLPRSGRGLCIASGRDRYLPRLPGSATLVHVGGI